MQEDEPALLLAECGRETHMVLLNEEGVVPKLNESQVWYLNNGANNHMIGRRGKFTELDEMVTGQVHFGDGSTVSIKGKVRKTE